MERFIATNFRETINTIIRVYTKNFAGHAMKYKLLVTIHKPKVAFNKLCKSRSMHCRSRSINYRPRLRRSVSCRSRPISYRSRSINYCTRLEQVLLQYYHYDCIDMFSKFQWRHLMSSSSEYSLKADVTRAKNALSQVRCLILM